MNRYRIGNTHQCLLARFSAIAVALVCVLVISLPAQAGPPINVSVDWSKTVAVSKSIPTMMVEVNPLLRQGSPIHETAFANIRELGARFVRYHATYVWPRLVVAELDPPTKDKTSWDFSKIDSIVIPFLEATKGHELVINFNTTPAWKFKTEHPVPYPSDPDQWAWYFYREGTEPVDPTGQQIAEYYARVISWYARGGFTDEIGQYHRSGYHYDFPWWEVLNEVEGLPDMTPQ